MALTKAQKLTLYSLGEFYYMLNQPLVEKPLQVSTSKIAFIELLGKSKMITKQQRALYKNLETLEKKKVIGYDNRMIVFTEKGLRELGKIRSEFTPYLEIQDYFKGAELPRRKLQTFIRA